MKIQEDCPLEKSFVSLKLPAVAPVLVDSFAFLEVQRVSGQFPELQGLSSEEFLRLAEKELLPAKRVTKDGKSTEAKELIESLRKKYVLSAVETPIRAIEIDVHETQAGSILTQIGIVLGVAVGLVLLLLLAWAWCESS
jgi:hypothetical protein